MYYRCGMYNAAAATSLASGTFTSSNVDSTTINLGFKPKYLCIMLSASATSNTLKIYNEDMQTTKFLANTTWTNLGGTGNANIYSINDNGFTVNKDSSARAWTWFAAR